MHCLLLLSLHHNLEEPINMQLDGEVYESVVWFH